MPRRLAAGRFRRRCISKLTGLHIRLGVQQPRATIKVRFGTNLQIMRRINVLPACRKPTHSGDQSGAALSLWACLEVRDRSLAMSWDRPFAQPVPLPEGPPAQTLRDAANYIRTLPPSERDCQEWRLAVHMLIDAAEDRGP